MKNARRLLVLLLAVIAGCGNKLTVKEPQVPEQAVFGTADYNIIENESYLLIIRVGMVGEDEIHYQYEIRNDNDNIIWEGTTTEKEQYVFLPEIGEYTLRYRSDHVGKKTLKILVDSSAHLYCVDIDFVK